MFLPTLIAQFGDGITSPSKAYTEGGTTKEGVLANFDLIISNILGIFTIVGALIFVIYFLIASIEWITAGGDVAKVSGARDKIIQGILGLVILVASYGLLGLIGNIVGIDVLNPIKQIENIIPSIGPN